MKKQYWQEILIVLSLANLLFISGWRRLLYPNSHVYHNKEMATSLDYLSLILLVVLLAGIFVGGFWLIRYLFKGETPIFAKFIFCGVLLLALNAVRLTFYDKQVLVINTIGRTAFLVILGIIGIAGLIAIVKLKGKFFSVIRTLVLILSPFVLITFSQSILGIFNSGGEVKNEITFNSSDKNDVENSTIKNRIIWIIFDELDYKVPFEMRPNDVKLPEFDRLQNETFSATKATSPEYETLQSIPSLITGKQVKKATPYSKNELMLNFVEGDEKAKFSETSTIFSKVKELGGKSAVVGWYHSYCRVFVEDLSACHWESYDWLNDFKSKSFSQSLQRDLRNLFLSLPLTVRFMQNQESEDYINRHNRMINASKETIKNPDFDLSLIHLTVPHTPYHFSRKQDKFVGNGDYLDNLVLADKTLGEIRQTLEKNKLWDDSTIVVSSDHQWRLEQLKLGLTANEVALTKGIEDQRIPFFVKLKNQNESIKYEKPFNTVITSELIMEIMKGEISTPTEIKEWLDKNGKGIPQGNLKK